MEGGRQGGREGATNTSLHAQMCWRGCIEVAPCLLRDDEILRLPIQAQPSPKHGDSRSPCHVDEMNLCESPAV